MNSSLLTYLAYGIGCVASLVGILAMLLPEKMSQGFGVPTTGAGVHYVRALGIRDVFVGIVVVLLGQSAQWTSLGYVCLAIALVATSDFYTVFRYGERRTSMAHLAGLVLSLGFSLLFFNS